MSPIIEDLDHRDIDDESDAAIIEAIVALCHAAAHVRRQMIKNMRAQARQLGGGRRDLYRSLYLIREYEQRILDKITDMGAKPQDHPVYLDEIRDYTKWALSGHHAKNFQKWEMEE